MSILCRYFTDISECKTSALYCTRRIDEDDEFQPMCFAIYGVFQKTEPLCLIVYNRVALVFMDHPECLLVMRLHCVCLSRSIPRKYMNFCIDFGVICLVAYFNITARNDVLHKKLCYFVNRTQSYNAKADR